MTLKSNKYVLTILCSYFRTVCFESLKCINYALEKYLKYQVTTKILIAVVFQLCFI